MKRRFRDIPKDKLEEEQIAFNEGYWGTTGIEWPELLKSDRILIISEAGAGKTFECQQQEQEIWDAGGAAFFLELAQLAKRNLQDMLSPDQKARFNAWLGGQIEKATFFLDSIDELKLTQGSFKQALISLANAIDGQFSRARIVVTSRPVAIDQEMFTKILPMPAKEDDDSAPAELLAKAAMGRHKKAATSEDMSTRTVALLPLTDEQIRELAAVKGVTNPDDMLADIKRRHAKEFARRPEDLIELCQDWQTENRIRAHLDQVRTNVRVKLTPAERENAKLSPERAAEGASRLALAALLTRRFTVKHSSIADHEGGGEPALNPAKILTDWSDAERAELLERPLFGFASYGRVRFHHRSVIEYLAAERLRTLLDKGMSIKAVKRILFATTAQGHAIVKPSMRPVAAWLALSHAPIYEEIRDREPVALVTYGDPESLRRTQRNDVLRAIVRKYGSGGYRKLRLPIEQIQRLASPELEPEIKRLWSSQIENHEIREFLLDLISEGEIAGCADIAYEVVMSKAATDHERISAMGALDALHDPRTNEVLDSMANAPNEWPRYVIGFVLNNMFPATIDTERFFKLLEYLTTNANTDASDMMWNVAENIAETKEPHQDIGILMRLLTASISKSLEWSGNHHQVTTKAKSLVSYLAAACLNQLNNKIHSDDVINSCALVARIITHADKHDSISKALGQAIESLEGDFRRKVLEADSALMMRLHPQSDIGKHFRLTAYYGPLVLTQEKDSAWILAALADQSGLPERRSFMLEAAIYIWYRASDRAVFKEKIKEAVKDKPGFDKIIEDATQPVEPDSDYIEHERMMAEQTEQQKKKEKEAYDSWIQFWHEIIQDPDDAFSDARMESTAWNLWKSMRNVSDNNRTSTWNRQLIEKIFNKAIADRFRSSLMKVWRKITSKLPSERSPNEKNVQFSNDVLSFSGLTAEAEDPTWATKLTAPEVELAVRYAPVEINGFPTWLDDLVKVHPATVDQMLGEELSKELTALLDSDDHSRLLQNVTYATTSVGVVFVPRLEQWISMWANDYLANKPNAVTVHKLSQVVESLLKYGGEGVRSTLFDMVKKCLKHQVSLPIGPLLMSVVLRIDPATGVDELEAALAALKPAETNEAEHWFAALFNDRHGSYFSVDLSDTRFTPQRLLRLTQLAYQYIRVAEDRPRSGAFTPDGRDDAESARNSLLNALLNTTGSDGWEAKLAMTMDPLFAHFKDRIVAIALERAAEEVDSAVFGEAEIVTLDKQYDLPPVTRDEMFAMMVDRLDDIEEALKEDESPRAMLSAIDDESVMRQAIARELSNNRRLAYTVTQEEVTADQKETDIRLKSTGSTQLASIELKIGDKDRSARELRDTIRQQLVKKYMAAQNAKSGCLLITFKGDRDGWQHPDTREKLDFPALVAMLNEEAENVQNELAGEIRLVVKGLDLRPRLPTEKAARESKSSAKAS